MSWNSIRPIYVCPHRFCKSLRMWSMKIQWLRKLFLTYKDAERNLHRTTRCTFKEIQKLTQSKLKDKIKFIIEGEEDLVALPFLMFSPDNWVICYGQPQPYHGMVIVHVNEDSRRRAKLIFNKVFNIEFNNTGYDDTVAVWKYNKRDDLILPFTDPEFPFCFIIFSRFVLFSNLIMT